LHFRALQRFGGTHLGQVAVGLGQPRFGLRMQRGGGGQRGLLGVALFRGHRTVLDQRVPAFRRHLRQAQVRLRTLHTLLGQTHVVGHRGAHLGQIVRGRHALGLSHGQLALGGGDLLRHLHLQPPQRGQRDGMVGFGHVQRGLRLCQLAAEAHADPPHQQREQHEDGNGAGDQGLARWPPGAHRLRGLVGAGRRNFAHESIFPARAATDPRRPGDAQNKRPTLSPMTTTFGLALVPPGR
jgi:hypothetical protein